MRNILVLPFDTAAAEAYGEIIGFCGWVKGQDFDRMIAAHAISARAVLVTNNTRDFQDIPRLSIENWATL
jgi:tRNA(fMet)-specific endonuclease VapC